MKVEDYNYELPEDAIAVYPSKVRGKSKILVVDTKKIALGNFESALTIDEYKNFYRYIGNTHIILMNNTKVVKARLIGTNKTGGKVELLILENHNDNNFLKYAIYKGNIKVNDKITLDEGDKVLIKEINDNVATIELLKTPLTTTVLDEIGHTPLPPYIKRPDTSLDTERYNNIFAQNLGSVAAPTASLNITTDLLDNLRRKSILYAYITLHCGIGTFNPIKTDTFENFKMHEEYFEIDQTNLNIIKEYLEKGKKVMGIGTTVVRTMEYLAKQADITKLASSVNGQTDIFIYPGYKFKIVDILLTNFHAPGSTPLILANAFFAHKLSIANQIGNPSNDLLNSPEFLSDCKIKFKQLYSYALKNKFKFLSYGDSMLII